jgi:hypothetical protein
MFAIYYQMEYEANYILRLPNNNEIAPLIPKELEQWDGTGWRIIYVCRYSSLLGVHIRQQGWHYLAVSQLCHFAVQDDLGVLHCPFTAMRYHLTVCGYGRERRITS